MARTGFDRGSSTPALTANGLGQNVLSNVAGTASLKPTMKYHTGSRAVIKINGKLVGFAFSVGYNIETDNQEIMTIDDYLPAELAPRMIRVSGSLGTFVVPGRSTTSELLQSNVLSFMQNKYITIEISDSATGSIIFKTNRAVITSNQTTVDAEQMSITRLSWKAIGWQNENQPQEPAGSDRDSAIVGGFANAINSIRGKK
jgi:hypothetical protein